MQLTNLARVERRIERALRVEQRDEIGDANGTRRGSRDCVLRHLMRAAIKGSSVAIRARRSSSGCVLRHLKLATLCHRHFSFILSRCLGERPRRRAPPVRRPRLVNGSPENRRLERRTRRLALGLADDAIPDGGRNQESSVAITLGLADDAIPDGGRNQESSVAIRAHQWRRCIHVRSVRGHQRSSERRYIHVLLAMRRFIHAHMGGDMLKRLVESFNACGRQALLITLLPSARVAALVVA